MKTSDISERLSALERDFAEFKAHTLNGAAAHPVQALERIHGTFEDDAAFQEAMLLGRKSGGNRRKATSTRRAKRK
jgi:hypothetical protein